MTRSGPIALRQAARKESVALTDGRSLAWSEWGPADGAPVVFCTGAGMSGSVGFGEDALEDLGLRLIAVDRPGLGRSDPHPEKTLDSFADDVATLLGALGPAAAGKARAVGFSQGAPFALALGARGIAGAVALVSGQDELGRPEFAGLLPPPVLGMIAKAQAAPEEFAADVAATASAEWLWGMIAAMSAPQDKAVYEAPSFAPLYRACLAEGFAQGPAGYARDLLNALRPWPFAVETIAVPVDVWCGGRDASPVHSPDFGASLTARLPEARRFVEEDQGGAILWTRARDILSSLAAR